MLPVYYSKNNCYLNCSERGRSLHLTCAYNSKFRLEFRAIDYGIMQYSYIVTERSVFGV